jgi:cyclopropane-fatty-acyl-phospholipid synthase
MGLYLWAVAARAGRRRERAVADAHCDEVESVLRPVYGADTNLWMRRWFFLATAGLFSCADGSEWEISRYRMKAG